MPTIPKQHKSHLSSHTLTSLLLKWLSNIHFKLPPIYALIVYMSWYIKYSKQTLHSQLNLTTPLIHREYIHTLMAKTSLASRSSDSHFLLNFTHTYFNASHYLLCGYLQNPLLASVPLASDIPFVKRVPITHAPKIFQFQNWLGQPRKTVLI